MFSQSRTLLFLMFTLVFLSIGAGAQTILKDTKLQGTVRQDDPTVMRSRNVLVDAALLRSDKSTIISVPLFDKETVRISRDELRSEKDGTIIWKGTIADQPDSNAIFVIRKDVVIADIITAGNRIFQIRFIGGERVHSLRQIDQGKFKQEADPLKPVPRKKAGGRNLPAADTCNTDGPETIDELVVYTQAARTTAGGTDPMIATVYLAVEETNQSYINSDIDQRLRIVHIAEVNYTESGDVFTDLPRLQNGSDGFMDNVPTLRNTFGADTVSLILQTNDYCGLGYFMDTINNSFESSAYNVVDYECATGYYSFGHELGHNMGADHEVASSTSPGAYTYDHGFTHASATPANSWRTVMSYDTSPHSTRVQYWSNPNINFGGVAMGTAATEDNHRVLNNTAGTVANFRCSSPGVGNVWMKDVWADTGAEPDPSTDPMWESPYIWVRNSQDTGLTHQHEHQDPKFGQTNYAYVKLHNGSGSSHTGQLDLRFARASTGLSWPADWTAVSGTPVNVTIAAHSTKIVEVPWSNVPSNPDQDQHYCMVAMWIGDAADPMAVPLGPDINADTQNNNNVVWRNMNIVDMPVPDSQSGSFTMRNVSREKTMLSLAINTPKRDGKFSFLRNGRIAVTFDEKLFELVRRGFKDQKGVKLEGRTFIITDPDGAVFTNIAAPRGFEGHVKLTFELNADGQQRKYKVVATQMQADANLRARVVGGNSFVIYAYKRYEK
jgi:peptidyl-Asp metalloendopeptidase